MAVVMIEFIKNDLSFTKNYDIRINNVSCGTFEVKEDGYWDWYPNLSHTGYIPSWFLHAIANKLDELNKPWDDEINKYFNNE
jgi:hypothetical protein